MDPRKKILGHLIDLVIFPLKFPLKPKKVPTWEGKVVEQNKNSFENLEASGKTWEHAKLDILKKVK